MALADKYNYLCGSFSFNLDDIPSLEGAAVQINSLKKLHQLELVFVATDAPLEGEALVWYRSR